MATLTAQTPTITGTTPTYSAVTSSDSILYTSDRTFLVVKNGGGSSTNVTVVVPGTEYGQPRADVVVAVPAAGERWIGPLVGDLATGTPLTITVNYSVTTSVTAALVQL